MMFQLLLILLIFVNVMVAKKFSCDKIELMDEGKFSVLLSKSRWYLAEIKLNGRDLKLNHLYVV